MSNWTIQPDIAEAILMARMLRIDSAQGAFENSVHSPMGGRLWESLKDQWEWHAAQSGEDLRKALQGGGSRAIVVTATKLPPRDL